MRLVNLLIMSLYAINIMVDIFYSEGSGFLRIILLVVALLDFALFVYVIISKLSKYLNFPVFGLPKTAQGNQSSTSVSNPKQVHDSENYIVDDFNDNKMQSSLEKNNGNRAEPYYNENLADKYPKDLEFDDDTDDFPEPFKNAEYSVKKDQIMDNENRRMAKKPQNSEEEEKGGKEVDISYDLEDPDDEDKI